MTEATFAKLRTSAAFDVVGCVGRVYGWIQRLIAQSQPSTVVHCESGSGFGFNVGSISEMIADGHCESSFHPCNIYRDCSRGVPGGGKMCKNCAKMAKVCTYRLNYWETVEARWVHAQTNHIAGPRLDTFTGPIAPGFWPDT